MSCYVTYTLHMYSPGVRAHMHNTHRHLGKGTDSRTNKQAHKQTHTHTRARSQPNTGTFQMSCCKANGRETYACIDEHVSTNMYIGTGRHVHVSVHVCIRVCVCVCVCIDMRVYVPTAVCLSVHPRIYFCLIVYLPASVYRSV